jgi:hypothetical protein
MLIKLAKQSKQEYAINKCSNLHLIANFLLDTVDLFIDLIEMETDYQQ